MKKVLVLEDEVGIRSFLVINLNIICKFLSTIFPC